MIETATFVNAGEVIESLSPERASNDLIPMSEEEGAELVTSYEFDAPRFFDFTQLSTATEGNDTAADDADPEVTIQPGRSRTPSKEALLFPDESHWFETCKYKVQSPDGNYFIPVKPCKIADDPVIASTPFGKLCLSNVQYMESHHSCRKTGEEDQIVSPTSRRQSHRHSQHQDGDVFMSAISTSVEKVTPMRTRPSAPQYSFIKSPLGTLEVTAASLVDEQPKTPLARRTSMVSMRVTEAADMQHYDEVPIRPDIKVTPLNLASSSSTSPARPPRQSPKHILDLADAIDRLVKPSQSSSKKHESPLKKTTMAASSGLLPVRSTKPLTIPTEFAFSAPRQQRDPVLVRKAPPKLVNRTQATSAFNVQARVALLPKSRGDRFASIMPKTASSTNRRIEEVKRRAEETQRLRQEAILKATEERRQRIRNTAAASAEPVTPFAKRRMEQAVTKPSSPAFTLTRAQRRALQQQLKQ